MEEISLLLADIAHRDNEWEQRLYEARGRLVRAARKLLDNAVPGRRRCRPDDLDARAPRVAAAALTALST
jgi:hypothetical protein